MSAAQPAALLPQCPLLSLQVWFQNCRARHKKHTPQHTVPPSGPPPPRIPSSLAEDIHYSPFSSPERARMVTLHGYIESECGAGGGTARPHRAPLLGVTATGRSVFSTASSPLAGCLFHRQAMMERLQAVLWQKGERDGAPGLCEPTKLLLTLTPHRGTGPWRAPAWRCPLRAPWPGRAVGLAVGTGLRPFSSTGQVQCGQVHCRLPYTAPPVHLKADMEGPLSNRGEKVMLVLAAGLGPTSSCNSSFCVLSVPPLALVSSTL